MGKAIPALPEMKETVNSHCRSSKKEDSANKWFYTLSCHKRSGHNHPNGFHLEVFYYKLEMVEIASYSMIAALPLTLKVGFTWPIL